MRGKCKNVVIVIIMAILMAIIIPFAGVKEAKADDLTIKNVAINIKPPVVGSTMPYRRGGNDYYGDDISFRYSSNYLHMVDSDGFSGYKNGIKWTDDSGKILNDTYTFEENQYYRLNILLFSTDTYNGTVSTDVSDYTPYIRGIDASDYCEVVSAKNKNFYMKLPDGSSSVIVEVCFRMQARKGLTFISYELQKPIVGEIPTQKVTLTVKSENTFIENTFNNYDISNTWLESTDNKNFKKMSTATFQKGYYYRTTAPELIKRAVSQRFYNKNYVNTSGTRVYGMSEQVIFRVDSISCEGTDVSSWEGSSTYPYEATMLNGGTLDFGLAYEQLHEIKIKNFSFPVAGKTIDTKADPDYFGYYLTEDKNNPGENVEWYDATVDESVKLSKGTKFIGGHTYIAKMNVAQQNHCFFNGMVKYIINDEITGYTEYQVVYGINRFIKYVVKCPTINPDEVINISGIEPIYADKSFQIAPSYSKWSFSGTNSNKYELYSAHWYTNTGKYIDSKDIVAGEKYRLQIYLSAKDGESFPSIYSEQKKIKVNISGAEKVSIDDSNENYLTIYAEFTAKETIKTIKISGKLLPVTGKQNQYSGFSVAEASKYSIDTTQNSTYFKNGIVWGKVDGGVYKSQEVSKPITFVKDETYFAKIQIKAADGEKFTSDMSELKATVGGVNAKVEVSEGGTNSVVVTVEAKAKDAVTEVNYVISTPVAGEKPGNCKVETKPENALKGSNEIPTASYWQVSDDGKTYVQMNSDDTFKAGKYYRTNVATMHQFALLLASIFGNVYDPEVTYGTAQDYILSINGKSITADGVLDSEGYYRFDKIAEPEDRKDDGKKDDKKDDGKPDTSIPGGEEVNVPGVGTISGDGKTLTDEDGKKFKTSDKLKASDLKPNAKIADKKSGGKYRITKIVKDATTGKVTGGNVEYMAPYNKNCKLISATGIVKLGGVKFKVTSIAANCAKGCKKLNKVIIGSYVTNVGKNAFSGCSKLKTITFKGTKLKKVGANAFKGINKKATINVPKAKKKAYTKLLKNKGQAKTVKIK